MILNEGKVEQVGTPWEIINKPKSSFVKEFMVFEKITFD